MKNKTLFFLVLVCLSTLSATAATTLDKVYNSFITFYSDGNPAWKTNITFEADVNNPPKPPFKLYYSDTFGYYTYRPKTWSELDGYEQFAVKSDPRMPHFIQQYMHNEAPTVVTTPDLIDQPTNATVSTADGQSTENHTAKANVPTETAPVFTTQIEHVNQPVELTGSPTLVPAPANLQQVEHVLTPEEKGTYGYTFTPADLTSTKPVKLVEVGQKQ
jgi:hypothetical protein